MSSEKELVRVAVLCINSLGEPELHSCAVEVFARNYAPTQDEWMYLDRCTRQVVDKRHEAV